MKRKQKMSFRDALALVPDDMPDGAAFALAHEYAGLEYGDGFDEIAPGGPSDPPKPGHKKMGRIDLARSKLRAAKLSVQEFVITHWRVADVVDYWPTKDRWRFMDGSAKGFGFDHMLAEIKRRNAK